MARFISVVLISGMLYSCDPGYIVVLDNKSQTDKYISVINVNQNKLLYTESIIITDTSGPDPFLNTTPKQGVTIEKTSSASYSFVLEKGREAILQNGLGGPDLREKIIVDRGDTISLTKDKRSVIKRGFMYTAVKATIHQP
jgi:hypothetical protein